MSGVAWAVPFSREKREKRLSRRRAGGGGTGGAATGGGRAAAKEPRRDTRPGWDSTIRDHSRFRLTEMEQEWRAQLRASKHRTRPPTVDGPAPGARRATVDACSLRFEAPEEGRDVERGCASAGCSYGGGDSDESESEEERDAPSLCEMKEFLEHVQALYGMTAAPPRARSAAHARLAQLQAEQAAGGRDIPTSPRRAAGERPEEEKDEKEEEDSDSACSDRESPCRQLHAGLRSAAGPCAEGRRDDAALLQRLAEVEARLAEHQALKAEVAQLRGQVSQLQEQNASLGSGAPGGSAAWCAAVHVAAEHALGML
eukprot:scaffold10.g2471.t1